MWQVGIKYYSEQEADGGKGIFYGNPFAAGIDLPFYDPEMEEVIIQPNERAMLKTGVYVEMPETVFGLLDSRSSTSKLKIDLLCRTIDPDYVGNIRTVVTNIGTEPVTVKRGDYLFQMIILPRISANLIRVESTEDLAKTDRGDKGFGSTGNTSAAEPQ